MIDDPFAQLAEQPVPPPPSDLERHVHQRVNRWLLGSHLLEMAARAAPFAIGHLARGFVAAVSFTATGKFGQEPPPAGEKKPPGGE